MKAGGLSSINHSRGTLKVRSAVKAGLWAAPNHTRSGLKVRSDVKAGATKLAMNHTRQIVAAA